ncbi:MAG: site-specific integrase [Alphaproteobacteria bacterium]|nr:site-specific integrase [Alphaproteobacteria bacterium]
MEDLLALGASLMQRAEEETSLRRDWRAALYRDGLTILLLIFRPLRRANLVSLRLGESLTEQPDGYWIRLPAEAMKNGRPYEARLPELLCDPLERYLTVWRPVLLRGRQDTTFLVGARGRPFTSEALYGRLTQHTEQAFGRPISPHLFRDIAVTALGEEDPELVHLGRLLLHHADGRTTEAHYNHAREHHAMRRYHGLLQKYRQQVGATAPLNRSTGPGPDFAGMSDQDSA